MPSLKALEALFSPVNDVSIEPQLTPEYWKRLLTPKSVTKLEAALKHNGENVLKAGDIQA